jgi:hypothetical protein
VVGEIQDCAVRLIVRVSIATKGQWHSSPLRTCEGTNSSVGADRRPRKLSGEMDSVDVKSLDEAKI